MNNLRRFDIKYDYSIIMCFSERSETLIGGSEKILKKALKNGKNPNLAVKDLDVYYRNLPLGTLALEIYQSAPEIDEIQNLVDKLCANLIEKHTNNIKIADTKLSLDTLACSEKHTAVIRVLARTILVWYAAVTNYYMNGKFGIPIPQKERAALGVQFRDEVTALIETMFTTLKKKISPQDNTEIRQIIKNNCTEIGEFLSEYSSYLLQNNVFCIHCRLCNNYFLANSRNARYCADCKLLRKKNSKKIYAEKCAEGVHNERQRVKFRFENFIHKNRRWARLSDNAKAEYKALHDEFIRTSAAMLRKYDEQGGADLERKIACYLASVDADRVNLECRIGSIR
ncbi:MAG: hypothetical protein NC299_14235 [Lachnospiraceae bacterium]|nr:hypothetical protein [Ruminococcus sp.]MCM1276496.1 hypothetical protein [Lachnospiraceae bacterium]